MHASTVKKIVSCLLVVCMFCGTVSATQIRPQNTLSYEKDDAEIIYESGDVFISMREDADGNMVLCEYKDGILTQRNTLFAGTGTYYQREIFGEEPVCELVNVEDYVTTETDCNLQTTRAAASTKNGVIQFRANTTYGYVYYKLNCVCEETYVGQTTHTVTNYMGKVVDLVSLLVRALVLGPSLDIFSSWVSLVLANAAIDVVDGEIKSPFTDTFACQRTDYYWSFADSNVPDEEKHQTGNKYFVNDTLSSLNGETIYEGYTPNDWRTSGLAVRFHDMVYAYTNWEVIGWSALG